MATRRLRRPPNLGSLNHGFQPGAWPATISREDQHRLTRDAVRALPSTMTPGETRLREDDSHDRMMLTRRTAAGLIVAALAAVWFLRPGVPRAAPPTAGTSIIAFGDSLVEGRGASPGNDFVSLLSKRLRVRIINAGRSGDTTGSALQRLNQDVLARNPRIVIVLLGGNDFLRRVPVDQTFGNLETIVERIRGRGSAVVLAGVSVGLISDPYGGEYERIARGAAAGLVPDILDGIFGRRDRMADTIHPNDRGYEMIADRLEPVLRELIDEIAEVR